MTKVTNSALSVPPFSHSEVMLSVRVDANIRQMSPKKIILSNTYCKVRACMLHTCETETFIQWDRIIVQQSFKLKARGPFTAHRLHRSFTAGSELTHIYCTVRTRKNHPDQPLVLESGKSSLRLKTLVFFAAWSSLTYKQRNRNWPHVNELNME